MAQDEEIRFALSVIDDNRRLIAAGKNQRWDVVKWAVTINVALAAASIAVKQQHGIAGGLFCIFAGGIAVVAYLLVCEITRRMTATRNDSLVPLTYLASIIDVAAITGKSLPDRYRLDYDKEELGLYALIFIASVVPAFLLWLLWK